MIANVPARRREIADWQNARHDAAVALLGRGAKAYGMFRYVDDMGLLPPIVHYVARWEGRTGWHPEPPPIPDERIPPGPWACASWLTGYHLFGQLVARPFRWSKEFGIIERYEPLSQAELDARRASRERGAIRREAEARPLFRDQILDKEYEHE